MTVVINEFEVVSEPVNRELPASESSGAEESPSPAASTPRDLERILEHLTERLARIAA